MDDSSDGSLGSPTSPPTGVYSDTIGRLRSSPSFDEADPKKKSSFAVFGQKLTQSAVAKYKKEKQSQDSRSSSLSLFRSSKSDLKNLRKKTDLGIQTSINAARSSINDRSPMARTSKELDRIANLGSPGGLLGSSPMLEPPPPNRRHHHMFHKKNSPQTILSSSASNSRLGSEGSVYSFQQAPSLQFDKGFKSLEDSQQTLDYTWSLLAPRTHSIFTDNTLRIPVEDINTLVTVHFGAHVASGGSPMEMMDRVFELLCNGLKLVKRPPQDNILNRSASIWRVFHTQTLLILEAVFLPLQLELEGAGPVLEEQGLQYWAPLLKNGQISIRRTILMAFRDTVLCPEMEKLMQAMNSFAINEYSAETAASINQCVNVVTLIKSQDLNQSKVDTLAATLRESWMARPRIAKDRRGMVLKKRSDSLPS